MSLVVKERTLKKVVRAVDTVSVFCDCRMPEDSSMVQCCIVTNGATDCVNVPKAALENNAELVPGLAVLANCTRTVLKGSVV